ncbi:MAG TPA: TlpA disulfide reductase family protein [Kiritimatiellia bacterium]|nr:TlpA disulfide reductase family protein [Kiritimatiellia bacterium]HMO97497.1 TlpA disulfide reductase family protein [Kiritimatiellia bacterium]HMP96306.1 TlpA disulfide reductase family protein [Kiritimatiellia bacterium]
MKNPYWGRVVCALTVLTMLAAPMIARAQGYSARHHEIVSQLQIMAQGTFTEAEWNSVLDRLDQLLVDTRAAGDWDGVIETQVIRAKVMAARGNHAGAMALMQGALKEFRAQPLPALKKVYVEIASLYAREGDEAGVKRIMDEFKSSPHYDGRTYSFSGGFGPNDPLVVPRPTVAIGDSVSMTAMEVQRKRAQHAPGTAFPDFNALDAAGRSVSLRDFQGKVVLVDFWVEGWFIWRRDLPYRLGVYDRHRRNGFEVLGLYIGRDLATGQSFAQANGITWPIASAPRPLLHTLGILGDSTNFLLDRNGMVIGRDLYGSDLEAAVRQALSR